MRQKLIWFACGAGATALSFFAAHYFFPKEPERMWSLLIWEEGQTILSSRPDEFKWKSAEIARDCQAKHFEIVPSVGTHSTDSIDVPLDDANSMSLDCILERSSAAKLPIGLARSESK